MQDADVRAGAGGGRGVRPGERAREPRRWKIIERVREKFSCRDCETINEPAAQSHPIPRGFAGLTEFGPAAAAWPSRSRGLPDVLKPCRPEAAPQPAMSDCRCRVQWRAPAQLDAAPAKPLALRERAIPLQGAARGMISRSCLGPFSMVGDLR
jgi:hypothetical protein